MKYILLLSLVGCQHPAYWGDNQDVIIKPKEAIRICDGKVKSYSALSGRVVCKK